MEFNAKIPGESHSGREKYLKKGEPKEVNGSRPRTMTSEMPQRSIKQQQQQQIWLTPVSFSP